MNISNMAAIVIFTVCFLGYHLTYFWITRRYPTKTKKGRINHCIESWLDKIIKGDDHLLLVHQLRNMIMAITFLASASVIVLGFLFNFSRVGEAIAEFPKALHPRDYPIWLIIFTLGYSFLNFVLALRHLSHLTVLAKSSPDKLKMIEGKTPVKYLEKLFVTGNQRYMMGRRGFLYGVVILTWYLNVWIFMGLTIFLTAGLAYEHDF